MKKLSLLLASIGAGLLLVGGTVAAYIVTSADVLGARVSPGNLQEDADGHITLSWSEKYIANVSGIHVGDDPQRVAEVTLGASSSDVDETHLNAFTGNFTVSLENLSNPGVDVPNLIDFLSIKTYKYNGAAYPEEPAQTGACVISAKRGDKYKTTVELLAKSSKNVDTASVFDVISQQIVYVSFSWGPDSSSADITNVRTVYFAKEAGSAQHVYFYAYKGTTINKVFPGVEMTKVYQYKPESTTYDIYAVEFDATKYTNYNFNTGSHAGEVVVAAPETPLTALEANPFYNNTGVTPAWSGKPQKLLAPYYLRGSIGGINYWGANADELAITEKVETETQYKIEITLAEGDEIKVYKPNGDAWYGPNDNFKVTKNGKHTIYVDETHGDTDGWVNHIYVAQPE